jgi:hypothetical protein
VYVFVEKYETHHPALEHNRSRFKGWFLCPTPSPYIHTYSQPLDQGIILVTERLHNRILGEVMIVLEHKTEEKRRHKKATCIIKSEELRPKIKKFSTLQQLVKH